MESEIKKIVAAHFEEFRCSITEMEGRSRYPRVVIPRQFAMALIRKYTGLSFKQIACEFGDTRDHADAIYGNTRVEEMRFSERKRERDWIALCQKIELIETPFEKELRFQRDKKKAEAKIRSLIPKRKRKYKKAA